MRIGFASHLGHHRPIATSVARISRDYQVAYSSFADVGQLLQLAFRVELAQQIVDLLKPTQTFQRNREEVVHVVDASHLKDWNSQI